MRLCAWLFSTARCHWAPAVVVLAVTLVCSDSRAEGHVPVVLQAQLVSRLGSFDRNFAARAVGPVVRALVVHKAGNAESTFSATSFTRALADLHHIGGIAASVQEAEFVDSASLAARCRAEKIAVLYLAEGLEAEMPRLASALAGADVLSIGSSATYAERGAVVGFDLEQARPKLVLNLRSAKAQNVSFKAELLKLGRILQ